MSLKNSICEDITFIYKYVYDFFIDLISVLFNKYVITAYSLRYVQLKVFLQLIIKYKIHITLKSIISVKICKFSKAYTKAIASAIFL